MLSISLRFLAHICEVALKTAISVLASANPLHRMKLIYVYNRILTFCRKRRRLPLVYPCYSTRVKAVRMWESLLSCHLRVNVSRRQRLSLRFLVPPFLALYC